MHVPFGVYKDKDLGKEEKLKRSSISYPRAHTGVQGGKLKCEQVREHQFWCRASC